MLLAMSSIRLCRDDERATILAIVNAAAEVYRGVIPPDRWHEFWGYESGGELLGAMGSQPVRDVELIRHAYVRPDSQGRGVGGALIRHLKARATRPLLVGTWAAAEWAIRFYERQGFRLVGPERTRALLQTYWSIPDRQIETSVVLALTP
jgi:GNAT superfamily N-acetyltransferase